MAILALVQGKCLVKRAAGAGLDLGPTSPVGISFDAAAVRVFMAVHTILTRVTGVALLNLLPDSFKGVDDPESGCVA
jgi:hypothetical protein